MWFGFALGSAVFAALTSILAKIGIEGVNSNLATQPEKLDLSDPVRPGHRSFLAVLLQSTAGRRGLEGRAHRQAERGHHTGAGLCFPA